MAASAEETNKRIDGDKNEKSDDEASKIPSNQNNESYNASRPPPRSYCHIGWTTIPDLLDELDNKGTLDSRPYLVHVSVHTNNVYCILNICSYRQKEEEETKKRTKRSWLERTRTWLERRWFWKRWFTRRWANC